MDETIAVIGLGKTGAAFAQALTQSPGCFVTGCGPDRASEKRALENKWVSRIEQNPLNAVKNAGMVLIALGAAQTGAFLESAGAAIRPDAVVLDCSPNKTAAAALARQYLADPDNFLGIWPGADQSVFTDVKGAGGRTLFIAADVHTHEEALSRAAELAGILKMEVRFTDPEELDGLIAAYDLLPQLLSNGMLKWGYERPGWDYGKKAAGQAFYRLLASLPPVQQGTEDALLSSREHLAGILDEYMKVLADLREMLVREDREGLREMLEENRQALSGFDFKTKEHTETARAADVMQQTFFGGFLRKQKKN